MGHGISFEYCRSRRRGVVIRDGFLRGCTGKVGIEAHQAFALYHSAHELPRLHIQYIQTRMPKVALSAHFISTCLAYTPSQEWRKVGLFSLLPHLPISLDEPFQLCKELLYGIHIRRIQRQVDQYHSCLSAQCLYHI